MAKEKEWCNEAERYLIQNWPSARLMEKAMESIRKDYKGIFERVLEAVLQSGNEFDNPGVFVTQFWGSGYVFLNRTAWLRNKKIWPPPGFYIENLRLELLCDKDGPAPYASIWLPAKKTGVDPAEARKAILEAVQQFPEEEARALPEGAGRGRVPALLRSARAEGPAPQDARRGRRAAVRGLHGRASSSAGAVHTGH